jgi:para-nitrobenzyl esterase
MFTGTGTERAGLAARMHGAWIAFASRGDPACATEIDTWPRYNVDWRSTYVFDVADRVIDDPDRAMP